MISAVVSGMRHSDLSFRVVVHCVDDTIVEQEVGQIYSQCKVFVCHNFMKLNFWLLWLRYCVPVDHKKPRHNVLKECTCPKHVTAGTSSAPDMQCLPMSVRLPSVRCPSHGNISKTEQDRLIVTMEHCVDTGDSVATFRCSP